MTNVPAIATSANTTRLNRERIIAAFLILRRLYSPPMADKFLSLQSRKQRVFALEVERFRTTLGERPVAVTAERGQLTVFCGKGDGTWSVFERPHVELDRT